MTQTTPREEMTPQETGSSVPPLPSVCWPVDWGCVPQDVLEGFSAQVLARAEALAVGSLRALTAYQVGGCPVTVRPCSSGCGPAGSYLEAPLVGANAGALGARVGPWWPHVEGGAWVNVWCGCAVSGCGCTSVPEVILPAPVGYVAEVRIDGAVLDASAYRVDDGNRLVRTDGGSWPRCQDMAAAPGEVGAFTVEYLHGFPVDGLGAYVAGVLAYEFALSCTGVKCRLPAGVTSVSRQGVSWDIPSGLFEGGLTGIREVDAWVRMWNPYHLVMAPSVWAPGLAAGRARATTWTKVVGS